MPRRAPARSKTRKPRSRKRRLRLSMVWPSARRRRQWLLAFQRAPIGIQAVIAIVVTLTLWLAVNWTYQVIRKPSELFFPVSGTLNKSPRETWQQYAPLFRKHATNVITADLLAAIAQVEGSGNPVVRTYWRWSFTHKPFEVYRPASSAVGMYQITDGTFAASRRYCIHDHIVVEEGPWNAPRSCWFNRLYTRVVPSHAVELTSAYLDRNVSNLVAKSRTTTPSLQQQQNLAALIHLCGAGAGERFARRSFQLLAGQRCGDHDVRAYLNRVSAMRRLFSEYESAT